ncbi:MAG: peptidylprolyl isomerase [DPANN group archaeon]|nr:peptidylprolyl isomerase [DPANN group archaeon]
MKDGDFVNIGFVGRIKESGEIFDLTDEELAKKSNIYNPQVKYGPVTVVLGAGQILPGLEAGIKKLSVKDNSDVELEPSVAFGDRDARLIKVFNHNQFKSQNIIPIPGHYIDFAGTKGRVVSVASGRVRMDFNHPLAGKTLVYTVGVNKIVEDASEQIGAIVSYYTAIYDNIKIDISGKSVKISLPAGSDVQAGAKRKITEAIIKYVTSIENVEFA